MNYVVFVMAIMVASIIVILSNALKRIKRIEVLGHFPPYGIPNIDTKLKTDGWISKEERVPEMEQEVYIISKSETDTPSVWTYDGDGFVWCFYVTHWMPLPEPPKQIVIDGVCTGCGLPLDGDHASWCRTLKNTGD